MTLNLEWLYEQFPLNMHPEERYKKIINLGKQLPPFPSEWATEEHRVSGCQSVTYVHIAVEEGKVILDTTSDALISAGLAALMRRAYHGVPYDRALNTPPHFLQELGILTQITPTRVNGILSFYDKMRQELLRLVVIDKPYP